MGLLKSNPIFHKRTVKTIKRTFFSLLLTIILIISIFSPSFMVSAATTEGYTSVLEDLTRDPHFNVGDYPSVPESNEIKIIHIGEGEDGELFIYTYQPGNETKHYKAKYINMSLQSVTDEIIVNKLYSLTWINSAGVFDKYIVNEFTVSSDVERYYNIAAIYRDYDETVDSSSDSEAIDSVQCKAFPVGQLWCLYYYNDVLTYEMETLNYVEYTVMATGSLRYTEGFKLYTSKCDSHYVALKFDNFTLDKIYDADITYTIEYRHMTVDANGVEHPQVLGSETVEQTLTEFDTGSNKGNGLNGKKYYWNRITTVEDFVAEAEDDANDGLSEEELTALVGADFVFRFAETDYEVSTAFGTTDTDYATVTNIGLLRMHFLSEGKTYNLGCVGDLVGTDATPELDVDTLDNIRNAIEDMFEKNQMNFEKIIATLLLVLLIIVFVIFIVPILTPIVKLILHGFGLFFGALWEIFSFPFRYLFKGGIK